MSKEKAGVILNRALWKYIYRLEIGREYHFDTCYFTLESVWKRTDILSYELLHGNYQHNIHYRELVWVLERVSNIIMVLKNFEVHEHCRKELRLFLVELDKANNLLTN